MARRPSPKKASAPKAGPQKASRPGATPVPEGPLPIQALLDAMHDTAMLVDLSGTILAVNRVACQRLGKTEEELLGADARKLRPADYSKEVSGRVVEVLTSQKAVRFTARSGDDILDTTISPVAGEGGKVESLAFFIRNITEQEATRAERSRLVEILENTSDLVGIATPDGRQSYLNRAGRRMLGWEETGDLGHRSVAEAHPPWAREKHRHGMRVAREKGLWVGETAILDPGGREIPVSQAIMAHGPKGGPVEYWSTIIRDISGAREALGLLEIQRDLGMAMAEARELPQALNRVLSAAQGVRPGSGAGVFLAEPPEGPLTLAAARGLPENLGRLGSVLLPDHPLALLAGVACPAYLPAGDLGLPDHEGAAAVVPLFSENRVEGVLVVLDAGEKGFSPAHRAALEGVASQAGRTLSRLRAGQRLKDSEEKHRSILENIEEGYWEQDLAGNFTFFNPSLCRVLGYTKRELMGMSFRQYVSPGTARRLYSLFNEMFRTGRPIRVTQYEAIRKDGRSIPVECTASLIRGPDGKPSGFRGLLRDVSERTRVEEQLGRLEERLLQSQKMEALGTLAGGIAHDFNNILMGILGNISLVLLDTGPSSADHRRLKDAEKQVMSGSDLTRQLLNFARGGKVALATVSMNRLVEETAGLFGRTRKELTLATEFSATRPVDVDPGQMEQVLVNLLMNAWQAMPGGGRVAISTADVSLDPGRSGDLGCSPGWYVRVTVTDEGTGMDPETARQAFDPFFTTRKKGRGTGLGLASAYGVLKRHGGFMTVESEPGRGSAFSFFLPASSKPLTERLAVLDTVSPGRESILVVDDEPSILAGTTQLLIRLGYDALAAGGPDEALEILSNPGREVDLVLLDVVMPGMSAGELIPRILALRPGLHILLCSGYSEQWQMGGPVFPRYQGFLQKPFTLEALSRKIREILSAPPPPPEA